MIVPDATEPVGSPYRRAARDMVAPATVSDWMRWVAHKRVFAYDRVRPYLSRLVLTVLLAACYSAMTAVEPWVWLLLTLPAAQCVIEIALEPKVWASRHESPDAVRASTALGPLGAMTRNVVRSYEERWLNAPGVLGGFAVVANVVAVSFGTHADQSVWPKAAALAVAMLYANSACAGPLLEATTYSTRAQGGSVMRVLRPAAWPLLGMLAAGTVGLAEIRADAWPGSAVPFAVLAFAIAYGLGLRVREHDRVAQAAGLVADLADKEAGMRVALELHDLVQLRKGTLDRVLSLPSLDAEDRMRLRTFLLDIDSIYKRARRPGGISLHDSLIPDAKGRVRQICAPHGIEPELEISLPEAGDGIDKDNLEYAKSILSTLTWNAVQAYARHPARLVAAERPLLVASQFADEVIVVAVRDELPLIPDHEWRAPGSTLAAVADRLAERHGELTQRGTPTGKVVEARWKVAPESLIELERRHQDSGIRPW